MKRYPKKTLHNVVVEAVAGEGKGLARLDGKVIFVENGLPGDVGDVLLTRNKKDFAVGRFTRIHAPSALRVAPFCRHFEVCGGCKWQNITYATQLSFKQGMVEEAFGRIGKMEFPALQPIIGCETDKFYRNKMEFTFSAFGWLSREQVISGETIDRRALGFHVPGRYEMVTHIGECFLMDKRVDEIRNTLFSFVCERNYEFYDLVKHTGFLRNLLIRSTSTDEWMVVVAFSRNDEEAIGDTMQFLQEKFPFIVCLQYTVNTKRNDAWNDLEIIHFAGKDQIEEKIGGVRFRISAQSFFQTNTRQANRLYEVIRNLAGLTGGEVVYDLYSGTGSIGLYLADAAGKIVGIEQADKAVADARHNAALNGFTNTFFESGTVEALLSHEFLGKYGSPDIVITDPPRAGMHPDVIGVLLEALPPVIIYVSCNPATQARDLQLLSQAYSILHLQPVDMFPQTWHIENVALLKRTDA